MRCRRARMNPARVSHELPVQVAQYFDGRGLFGEEYLSPAGECLDVSLVLRKYLDDRLCERCFPPMYENGPFMGSRNVDWAFLFISGRFDRGPESKRGLSLPRSGKNERRDFLHGVQDSAKV